MLSELISKNRKNTVIHYLGAIRRLRNPDSVVVVNESEHLYSHTNTRGKTRYLVVFDTFAKYRKSKYYNTKAKAMSCNGFWIVETDSY